MARLVLVHGFTQTGASWDPVARRLAARGHEVITPDLPGHGARTKVRATLPEAARLLADECGPACYVGYSLGGRVCLQLAWRHPEVVERLVVLSANAGIDGPDERAARRAADNRLADELEASGDVAGFLERWLAGPLFASLPPEAAGMEARLVNTADGLASSLRLAGTGAQEPLWDRLGSLPMPVLVLAGELDEKFRALGERLVAAIGAYATLEVITGAGHAAHLERPDAFAAVIAAQVPPPDRPRT
jgi:2-succinyl-6-hydroxy-2,4-cyclohexadiene-1-carboxylate synthase